MSKVVVIGLLGLMSGPVLHAVPGYTEVSGIVQRTVFAHQALGAHVHVQLLDAKGAVIAERIAALPPTAPRSDATANRRVAYHVRFAAGDAAGVVSHRAILHMKPHQS